MKNHTLTLNAGDEGFLIKMTGVLGVKMLLDKEAQISLSEGTLVIKGGGITANKLDVDDGNLELNAANVSSLAYSGGSRQKTAFKDIFK